MEQNQTQAQVELAKAVAFFKTQAALALALGVRDSTVSEWMNDVRPVPPLRALELQSLISDGSVSAIRLNAKTARLGALNLSSQSKPKPQPDQKRVKRAA